jgi:hypothetical protein
VAFLRSIDLDEVTRLASWINEKRACVENLGMLDNACKNLLGDHIVSSTPPGVGNIAIVSLRIVDLVLVSHVCSHMGNFYYLMSKHTSTGHKFQISSLGVKIVDTSLPSETGTISFSQRSLKCLNGFFGGEQVWVLHGPSIDPMDTTELFLSTMPDAFADVWGPMWKITNVGKPLETLRYDLEYGSVVPFNLISGSTEHSVKAERDEELCHWISNSELEKFETALASNSPPQIIHPRLLIGACRHSITPNTEKCYCNLAEVNNRFVSNGYRRLIGASPVKWATESRTMGTTIGGAGVGAPAFQYSQTKKKDGTPVREAFHKRWKNMTLRPWSLLLMRFGLQVSLCTRNSRKVGLVDLIAGDMMKEYMKTNPSYASEPWREAFEEMLHTDPARLVDFQAENSSERQAVEQYITACLDGLIHTGIGSRGHDPFVALWVYNGQPWQITLPRQCYAWTGFAQDSDSTCSFIVFEKCLINTLGLGCCHPREGIHQEHIQRLRRDTLPVLETFLKISERGELPVGLYVRQRGDGRKYWSIGDLRDRKHCIKLGKQGKLAGECFRSRRIWKDGHSYSKRVLTGKWSSENPVAASTRLLSAFFTTPENHTEHICDDPDGVLSPLPYLVQDET